MMIFRLDKLSPSATLLLALIITSLTLLLCYFQGANLLEKTSYQHEKMLQQRLSLLEQQQLDDPALIANGLPLKILRIDQQPGNRIIPQANTSHATSPYSVLYPGYYQPREMQYHDMTLTFQPDFTLVEQSLSRSILLLLGTIFASFTIMYLLHRHVRQRLEQDMIQEIESQQKEHTLFPGVTQAMERRFKEMHLLVEEAERRVLELELRVNQDPLTGLLNRVCFRQDLLELLHQESQSDMNLLAIVRATELASINQQRGYVAGDQYL